MRITSKHIAILKVLANRKPMIATWSHQNLRDIVRMGFASYRSASSTNGKMSSYAIFEITETGLWFLANERGGQ